MATDKEPGKFNVKKVTSNLSKFVRFSSMGLQIGLTIWLASLIGGWLDNKYPNEHLSYFKILTLLAVFGTTYSFIRQIMNLGKKEEKDEPKN